MLAGRFPLDASIFTVCAGRDLASKEQGQRGPHLHCWHSSGVNVSGQQAGPGHHSTGCAIVDSEVGAGVDLGKQGLVCNGKEDKRQGRTTPSWGRTEHKEAHRTNQTQPFKATPGKTNVAGYPDSPLQVVWPLRSPPLGTAVAVGTGAAKSTWYKVVRSRATPKMLPL